MILITGMVIEGYHGGYKYIEGWWEVAVRKMLKYYQLPKGGKILDVGCGKGYMLYDF